MRAILTCAALLAFAANSLLCRAALRDGMDGEYFSVRKSKLEKRLIAALGPAAAAYRIDDGGKRPRKYRLRLLPEAVRFVAGVVEREGN